MTRTVSPWRERFWAAGAATLYFALLYHVYVVDLRKWDYMGFQLGEFDTWSVLACWAMAIAPIALLATRIEKFSSFIAWCLYFFVYAPAVLYPVLQGLQRNSIDYSIALCAGFCLLVAVSGVRPRPVDLAVRPEVFHAAFWGFYAVLTLYTLSVFGGSLTFASVTEVYDQRSLGGDLTAGTFVGYATGWLSGCFNPMLMGIGLVYRRKWLFAIGCLGQALIYSTAAMKSVLASVVLIGIIYLLALRKEKVNYRGIAIFSVASLAVPLAIGLFVPDESSLLFDNITSLVYMRTYGMVGALSGTYFEFFSNNPLTYYSHINVVRSLVSYPYADSIGEVIGQSMGLDMNANANFFATDGMAAAGLTGVVLIGAVAGLVLRGLDALVPRQNLRLACAAAIPAIISLSNSSMFTTMLTGGLIPLSIAICFWRPSFLPGRPKVDLPGPMPRKSPHAAP